jgi:hypothetical protein
MFYAPVLVFGGTDGVGSRFQVLRARNRFWRSGGRRVPFSCFAHPDSFSAVPRASSPVLMFCAPGHIFGGTKSVESRFHVLRSGTRFRRYRVRRVTFSCFALSKTPEHVFGGTEVVGSRFHVLRSRTHFSAVRRASGPIFMFCAPGLVFSGTEGVGVQFLCFALPDSFSAVPRASAPDLKFCTPELVFGGTDGVPSRFHVLCSRIRFRRCGARRVPFSCFALQDSFSTVQRASGTVFMFCAPGIVFGGAEGVGSCFHVLRSPPHFRRFRGRRVLFSCFALPDSFSAVPRASCPVFMFCVPVLVFGGAEGVGSCFRVLRSRTHFRRYRGHRLPFSCFARPNSFSAVPSASGHVFLFCASAPVFLFCAPGPVFDGVGGVVPFLYFALPDSFSAVPRASGLVFMFCVPILVFGLTEDVGSRFHVVRSLTRFWRCGGRRLLF